MELNDYIFKKQWLKVADKTEQGPFFNSRPAIKTSPCKISITEKAYMRYIYLYLLALGLTSVGAVLSSLPSLKSGEKSLSFFFSAMLGLIMFFAGIILVTVKKEISWHPKDTHLHIHYGSIIRPQLLSIPKTALTVNMTVADNQHKLTEFYYGSVILSLSLKDALPITPQIKLLVSNNKKKIAEAFNILSDFLESTSDSTIEDYPLPNDRVINILKTGTDKNLQISPEIKPHCKKLTDKLIFKVPFYFHAVWLSILLFGITGQIYWYLTQSAGNLKYDLKLFIFPYGIFIAVGAAGFCFRTKKIVIDKQRKTITVIQGLLGSGLGTQVLGFDQICAIQLCPKYLEVDETTATVFELNIVLDTSPIAERIHILDDKNDDKVYSYTKILADFINKPIIDHRQTEPDRICL